MENHSTFGFRRCLLTICSGAVVMSLPVNFLSGTIPIDLYRELPLGKQFVFDALTRVFSR